MRLTRYLPFGRERRAESSLENPSTDLAEALRGDLLAPTAAGITVTPERSLRLISVYACVRVVSEAVASLPFPIYRREGSSRIAMPEDPRWQLLNEEPNPEMYAMELWELILGHANLWGSGYVYLVRNGAGEVVELWPLMANRTGRMRTPAGELYYWTILDNGEYRLLPPRDVLEVRAFMGLSPIAQVARDEIASGLAASEYGLRFWSNSARPDGLIVVAGNLDDDQFNELKRRWMSMHQGLSRSHLVGILTNGATWKDIGIPPEHAQFLETRKWTHRQIASAYRVPPYKIGDLEPGSVSYASAETQQIDFVVDSLRPWTVRTEQAVKRAIFNLKRDRASFVYPEFKLDALLRGDTLSRYRAYAIGIQWGFLSRADVRELENLTAEEGLDEFLIPANMLPAGDQSQVTEIVDAARQLGLGEAACRELELMLEAQFASTNGN